MVKVKCLPFISPKFQVLRMLEHSLNIINCLSKRTKIPIKTWVLGEILSIFVLSVAKTWMFCPNLTISDWIERFPSHKIAHLTLCKECWTSFIWAKVWTQNQEQIVCIQRISNWDLIVVFSTSRDFMEPS